MVINQSLPIHSGGGGVILNKDLTPGTQAEQDAVRELLKTLRDKAGKGKGQEEISSPNTARVTVQLPSEAKLWVDGVYCPLTSNVRSFNTPVLQPGREYTYNIRIQVTQNGQARDETRRVLVSANRQITVDFNNTVSTVQR